LDRDWLRVEVWALLGACGSDVTATLRVATPSTALAALPA
jgi:hypothetical protein